MDIDDEKLELARKNGATHTINSRNEDAAARIKEITDGLMADFVIEGTGIPDMLNEGDKYLKNRGRLVIMSSHERAPKQFTFVPAFDRGISIIAASPSSSLDPEEDLRRASMLINKGTIHNEELISHRFMLEDINEAFHNLENKPKGYIKGIVVCNKDM